MQKVLHASLMLLFEMESGRDASRFRFITTEK